jgi:hypothetical protein
VFSVGGAGDPPAPPGDPPGDLAVLSDCEKSVLFRSMPLPVPSGGSPDGTGGSPVLPYAKHIPERGEDQREGRFRLHTYG